MKALGGWCFRHRRIVLALWLAALILTAGVSQAAGTAFSTKFTLPNTESATAIALLQKDFPAASGSSDQIVFSTSSGTVRDPAVQARASDALTKIATLPSVQSVVSPYTTAGAK